jgi:hypothetical protein
MSNTNTTSATKLYTHDERMAATAHFKVYGNGLTPLVTVGNCTTLENGRRIINLNFKTLRDFTDKRPNASMSYPTVASGNATESLVARLVAQYGHIKQGDMVSAVIEDGYVKRLLPATSQMAAAIDVSSLNADAPAGVDAETGEIAPDADAPDADAPAPKAVVKATGKKAEAAPDADLPF